MLSSSFSRIRESERWKGKRKTLHAGVNEERTSNLRASIAENLFPFIRFAYVSTLCPTILHSRSINFQRHQRKKRWACYCSGNQVARRLRIHWPASISVYTCIPVCVCARRTERFLHARELASSKVKRAKKRLAILGKREGEREVERKRERETESWRLLSMGRKRKGWMERPTVFATPCIEGSRYCTGRIRTQRWEKRERRKREFFRAISVNFHHFREEWHLSFDFFFFSLFLFVRLSSAFTDAKHVFNRSPRPLSNFDVFYDPFYASFFSS